MPIGLLSIKERDASYSIFGSCRLWIPYSSLPCSSIHRHALVMQNTTFCVTVYRSNVQFELQSVCKEILYRFNYFSFTHPSIIMLSIMQNTTFCVTVYRSDVQSEMQVSSFCPKFIFLFVRISSSLVRRSLLRCMGLIFCPKLSFTSSKLPSSWVRRSLQNRY